VPDLVGCHAEELGELADWDDDAAAEAEAGDVAGVDEFVGGAATDAESLAACSTVRVSG